MEDEERPAGYPREARVSLAIALFGAFDVRLEGRPLPRLHSQKTRWLLALLALQEGRAVERAWLAGTLWPDSAEPQAAFNLRRNLWHLRRSLGPEARRIDAPSAHTVRLDLVGAEADILVFDEAIARGDAVSLEQAVTLHRGPLLQDCGEEWVLPEREAREQVYLAALETLAAQATGRGEHTAAGRYLRRLVVADPLRDSAQRALMQALAAAGETAAVTQVYRDFRLYLHRELNATPDPETIASYQQIRTEMRRRLTANHASGAAEGGYPPRFGASGSERQRWESRPDHLASLGGAPRPDASIDEPHSADELRRTRPPLVRLPRPLTRLVGREREVKEIRTCLGAERLLTLTGPGGIGKTRLAIQAAEEVVDEYCDGAWFVDLAPLADAALVPLSVAQVLGVRTEPGPTFGVCPPLTATLQAVLGAKQLLLVLDNCEHLLTACAQLAEALLTASPHLRILATGRQSLGLTGEVVWRVPPLSLPPSAGALEPSALLQYEAVRLFVERGTAAERAFALSERNAQAVAEVCRKLDGIPLAIELAAARLKALDVEQMAGRLDDRFRLLTEGSRTAAPRHQTLRATVDWSYHLLSDPERTLLRRLSVFAGGWTLEAAEAVCGDEVLDLLTALVEKSLVQFEEQEDGGRYRFLETVREYARDRLQETGEAPTVRGRHLSYFWRHVEEAAPRLSGREQGVWLDRLEREHDNLHAAIDWSLTAEEGCQEGLALILELLTYWDFRSCFGEAREYLKRFTDRTAEWPIDARTRLLHLAGLIAMKQADYPAARRFFEEGRTLRREQGGLTDGPGDLQCYGALALHEGDYAQAKAFLQESLRLYREDEQAGRPFDISSMVWTVDILGLVAYYQGDFPSARSFFEQSLTLFRRKDGNAGIASALLGLGRIAAMQGAYCAARALLDQSLSLFRSLKVKHSTIEVLNSLARICWLEGEYATARGHLVESLALCRETRRFGLTIDTLVSAGHLAQRQEHSARAVRLLGAAAALRESIGEALHPVERAEYEAAIAAARTALGDAAFAAARTEGRALTLPQAVAFALEDPGD